LQLVDASTLKREVAEGVDIMVVRELTGGMAKFTSSIPCNIYLRILMNLYIQMVILFGVPGIYFGKPRGFGTNEKGEDTGFNTEVYSVPEVIPLFDTLSSLSFPWKIIFKQCPLESKSCQDVIRDTRIDFRNNLYNSF
jgi:hypothetical protein